MVVAFFTAFLFSLSTAFAARSTRILGGTLANLLRMSVAILFLGVWAFAYGQGVSGPALSWFLISGVIGFGIGDFALFSALPRIGPRLSIMLMQCLASPIAIGVEQVWLKTRLAPVDILWSMLILTGVCVALIPDQKTALEKRTLVIGSLFGILAATGQALGAVISRKGYEVAHDLRHPIDGGTAAFQRLLGGITLTILIFLVPLIWKRFIHSGLFGKHRGAFDKPLASSEKTPSENRGSLFKRGLPWVLLNAMSGPILGIACYQHALGTTPSGLVMPIVATAPVFTIGIAFLIDGDRPSLRSIFGSVLAVVGAICLVLP
jgi:drug/metabolite transporter (DMT)-like permease